MRGTCARHRISVKIRSATTGPLGAMCACRSHLSMQTPRHSWRPLHEHRCSRPANAQPPPHSSSLPCLQSSPSAPLPPRTLPCRRISLPTPPTRTPMGGASSNRRQRRINNSRHRRSASSRTSPVPIPPSTTTLTFSHHQITSGPGYDLLRKSGWLPGEPLGSPATPSSPATPHRAPLPLVLKRGRAGLGAASSSAPSTPSSPAPIKHLANSNIFDPLRPRCQFDPTHVVSNLKALRKHERTCPANPHRNFNAVNAHVHTAFSPLPTHLADTLPVAPTLANQFSSLADSSDASSQTSLSSQSDSSMSALSSVTAPPPAEHFLHQCPQIFDPIADCQCPNLNTL